ncbi:hypothetical protein D9M69_378510 [compost metagenome]
MTLDPREEAEHHELDQQLLNGVVVRLLQVIEHRQRDLVDPRDVVAGQLQQVHDLGIDVVHRHRLEGHALLQEGHLLGVVHAAELGAPLVEDAINRALILDRRRLARALDHAGYGHTVGERLAGVLADGLSHANRIGVQLDRREPHVVVGTSPAHMVNHAHRQRLARANPVVRQEVAALQHLDLVVLQRPNGRHVAVVPAVDEAVAVAAQPRRHLLALLPLERRLEAVGLIAQYVVKRVVDRGLALPLLLALVQFQRQLRNALGEQRHAVLQHRHAERGVRCHDDAGAVAGRADQAAPETALGVDQVALAGAEHIGKEHAQPPLPFMVAAAALSANHDQAIRPIPATMNAAGTLSWATPATNRPKPTRPASQAAMSSFICLPLRHIQICRNRGRRCR